MGRECVLLCPRLTLVAIVYSHYSSTLPYTPSILGHTASQDTAFIHKGVIVVSRQVDGRMSQAYFQATFLALWTKLLAAPEASNSWWLPEVPPRTQALAVLGQLREADTSSQGEGQIPPTSRNPLTAWRAGWPCRIPADSSQQTVYWAVWRSRFPGDTHGWGLGTLPARPLGPSVLFLHGISRLLGLYQPNMGQIVKGSGNFSF